MSRDFPGNADLSHADVAVWSPGGNPFAMSAWVYRDTATEICVASKGWQSSNDRSWILYIPTTNVVNLALLQINLNGRSATKSGFTNGAWHQVGWEYEGQDGAIRVILDGVAGTSVDTQNSAIHASAALPVRIGSCADNTGGERYMDGGICEVGAWGSTLSVAEWGALAKGVPPVRVRPGSLSAYLPIWGVGSTEPDLSGNGNHFTINGTLNQRDHAPVGCPFPVAA